MGQHDSDRSPPMTKRSRNDNDPGNDGSAKKIRTEPDSQQVSLSDDASPHDHSPATDDRQQDFEADIAKAIKLSMEQAEKYHCGLNGESSVDGDSGSPTSLPGRPQQQHHCPVCSATLVLSIGKFEQHVNECLDQGGNTLSTSTTTDKQQTSSWKQLFTSIPKTLHNAFTSSTSATTTTTTMTRTLISSTTSPRRYKSMPDYKWMKDTNFVVDAFSYGKIPDCEGYFLTHFHSDHYGGLSKSWSYGPIFCSQITANLVKHKLQVDEGYLSVLPMNEPTFVLPTIKVTLIDANHCPGSVLFVFDIQHSDATWTRHLHTGDFRANPEMCLHPLLRQPDNPTIDTLYLDTTYLNAKYGFPAQEECIQAACRAVESHIGIQDDARPKTALDRWVGQSAPPSPKITQSSAFDALMTGSKVANRSKGLLVVVGTYSIGKEKVFCALAKLLGSKIFVTQAKRSILRCQENKELENLLTLDQNEAQVHVVPLNHIKPENMYAYLKSLSPRFTSVVAFRPTGWTFRATKAEETEMEIGSLSQVTTPPLDRRLVLRPGHSSPTVKIYGVPYSEHSSFRELASFIASLDINHVVPTVNNESEKARTRMAMYLNKWGQDKQGKPIQVVPYPAISHW
ncbi:hypothetical protein [Absidia glauca]|uniref:DNA repair metallo-beta-lactamase domain-containing protein n=1 Tax=Absidia glauca TaxID=4829 RepID=A0A168MQS0_ABSGL|nr:hypothetical protein [Absidia glauca]